MRRARCFEKGVDVGREVRLTRRFMRPNGLLGESEGTFQRREVRGVVNEEEEDACAYSHGEEGGSEPSARRFGPRGGVDETGLSYASSGRLAGISCEDRERK